jgi:hypothetical protein
MTGLMRWARNWASRFASDSSSVADGDGDRSVQRFPS